MRSKLAIPAVIISIILPAPSVSLAQVNPAVQPPVESAHGARMRAHHRERTYFRPGTSTGMSRDTPGARRNWYKGSP
jgi:hypothetical protein